MRLFRWIWVHLSGEGSALPLIERWGIARSLRFAVFGGVPLPAVLRALHLDGASRWWRTPAQRCTARLAEALEDGASLSSALEAQPRVFRPWESGLARAGERSGDLLPCLEAWESLLEGLRAVRRAVVGIAIYPAVLFSITVGVLLLITEKVLPTYDVLYTRVDAPLPASTRALAASLAPLRGWVWAPLLAILLLVLLLAAVGRRVPFVRLAGDWLLLRLPMARSVSLWRGRVVTLEVVAAWLSAGAPLHEALERAAEAQPNRWLARGLRRAARLVADGDPLPAAGGGPLLDAATARALRLALRSPDPAGASRRLAGRETGAFEGRARRAVTLLEVGTVAALGVALGAAVFSVYAAIFGASGLVTP